jgi:5-methylcytosine-specific restriction protein A
VGGKVEKVSPYKPLRPCKHPGCPALCRGAYCPDHTRDKRREVDRQRGTANQRGYTYRWQQYSKWYLSQPGNEICKLRIDKRCNLIAECVDHIVPPEGPNDPKFWDESNHQPSCLICNSIKGNKTIKGTEWNV